MTDLAIRVGGVLVLTGPLTCAAVVRRKIIGGPERERLRPARGRGTSGPCGS